MWKPPWSSGLTKSSLMLLHQEVLVSTPEKAEFCKLREKRLTRDLQHGARSTVKRRSHKTAQMMQSGVNPHTTGRIVNCRIVN